MSMSGTTQMEAVENVMTTNHNHSSLAGLRTVVQQYSTQRESVPVQECDWYEMDPDERTELVMERLERIFWRVYDNKEEELEYPTLSNWENVQFSREHGLQPVEDDVVYMSRISRNSLENFMYVLDVMRVLVQNNAQTTVRDIYYQHFRRFSCQREVDRLVKIAVAMLEVPRLYLGVVATSKGLVVGNLSFTNEEGIRVDCRLAVDGESIPQDVPNLTDVVVEADLVIVVEKDAIFKRLMEEQVLNHEIFSRTIFITGKGMPDIATRQLVSLLSNSLPVLVLTDCDPYGLEIFFTYKFGSLASTWSQEPLAAPFSLWLGVHPTDLADLGVPDSSLKPHSVADKKRILDFDRRQYVQADPQLREDLELMWRMGGKAEIEQISEERERGFLVNNYLAGKIAELEHLG